MVLLELISSVMKRLSLTDQELNSIKVKSPKSEAEPTKEGNILVNSLKKYMNMYFDDYYQLRGFQDEEYRKVLDEIGNEIRKEPDTIEYQIENLKQFQAFSKAMHRAIIKNLKASDDDEAP